MKYVVGDFESTAQKIIHSISFTPVDITEKKTWVSHGRHQTPEYRKNRSVTHGEMRTIFIKEALEDPLVAENDRVQAKLGRTIIHGQEAVVLPFRDAVCEFMHCVWSKGMETGSHTRWIMNWKFSKRRILISRRVCFQNRSGHFQTTRQFQGGRRSPRCVHSTCSRLGVPIFLHDTRRG